MNFHFIFVVVFCLSPVCFFAQSKPSWIDAVENALRQNETWKLDRKSARDAKDYFEYNFELKSGERITNIQIQILKDASDIEKRFAETVENLTNGMGRFSTRTKLKNLGDEAFMWINVNKNGWTMLRLRKREIFVEVFSLSEEAAKSFARKSAEQIP